MEYQDIIYTYKPTSPWHSFDFADFFKNIEKLPKELLYNVIEFFDKKCERGEFSKDTTAKVRAYIASVKKREQGLKNLFSFFKRMKM